MKHQRCTGLSGGRRESWCGHVEKEMQMVHSSESREKMKTGWSERAFL